MVFIISFDLRNLSANRHQDNEEDNDTWEVDHVTQHLSDEFNKNSVSSEHSKLSQSTKTKCQQTKSQEHFAQLWMVHWWSFNVNSESCRDDETIW